jgi:hypothetical protein
MGKKEGAQIGFPGYPKFGPVNALQPLKEEFTLEPVYSVLTRFSEWVSVTVPDFLVSISCPECIRRIIAELQVWGFLLARQISPASAKISRSFET